MDGAQQRKLYEALITSFPDTGNLRRMVRFGLDQNLDAIANTNRLSDAVYELIRWAESRSKIAALIVAARNSNPDNSDLRHVAEGLHLAAASGELESIVISSVGFSDVETWRARMSRSELAVCRVETPYSFGTGFLVNPDVLVTNHHVMDKVIAGEFDPQSVILRFDYKMAADGATVQPGQEFKLATDWLIDSSPLGELDYALLRTSNMAGEKPVANQQDAPIRGWLTPKSHTFTPGETMFIIQHPEARPLKLSSGIYTSTQIAPPRIIHSVSTLGGASGSPCFTSDWKLVALHNAGPSSGNEAIPFSDILQMLQERKSNGVLKNLDFKVYSPR